MNSLRKPCEGPSSFEDQNINTQIECHTRGKDVVVDNTIEVSV